MKLKFALIMLLSITLSSAYSQGVAADHEKVKGGELIIQPVSHATFVLTYQKKNIYVDPTGGAEPFKGIGSPDIILITDIHGDHFDIKTVEAIMSKKTMLVVPQAVADKLPTTIDKRMLIILNNGESNTKTGISIAAVPMYNLPGSENANYHVKGRGNGYILQIGGKNIYISGDTADTPEMRALKNIDIAFVCMNLPYTMDVNAAAQGVLAFKPRAVYPYHYKGQDVEKFKSLVNAGDTHIDVRLRNWYAAAK